MSKKNYRAHYSKSQVISLREKVKYAYKILTQNKNTPDGLTFDDKAYKLGGQYDTLIGLLETHCIEHKGVRKKIISESTLHTFFTGQFTVKNEVEGISFESRTIVILNQLVEVCENVQQKSNPIKIILENNSIRELVTQYNQTGYLIPELSDEIHTITRHLQQLYEEDEILQGVDKANLAYSKYGTHPKILRHFFRFNMRLSRWQKIDSETKIILQSNPSDEILALCKLATIELKLRDAYSNFHPDNSSRREIKINEAQHDLDSIPQSQHNKEYWYWQGRWYLERWHHNKGVNKSDLKLSLSHFEASLKIKLSWFVLFYKCVVLKILRGESDISFAKARETFTAEIIQARKDRPKMASIRTYRISSFLLNKNIRGLRKFINEIEDLTLSATDFSSTMKHHLDLIFFNDKNKYNIFYEVLDKWDIHH